MEYVRYMIYDTEGYIVRYGIVRYGIVWYGTVWYGIV